MHPNTCAVTQPRAHVNEVVASRRTHVYLPQHLLFDAHLYQMFFLQSSSYLASLSFFPSSCSIFHRGRPETLDSLTIKTSG